MGDEIAAETAIRDALRANLDTAEIDNEIIVPALWLVGDLWQRGEISVVDEHIATEISIRVLALQREAQRTMASRPEHSVMLATPAGESHDVALRMISNLLRGAGYGVHMLGAGVPVAELAAVAERLQPDVICLSATMPGGADRLLLTIHEIEASYPRRGVRRRRSRRRPAAARAARDRRVQRRHAGRRVRRRDGQARRPQLSSRAYCAGERPTTARKSRMKCAWSK